MAQNPNMNKGDVANAIEHNWSNPVDPADPSKGTMGFKDNMIAGLQSQAETLAKKAAGMDANDPKKADVIAQLNKLQGVQKQFAAITPDQVKQAFFPDVAQEEANTKTALLAAKAVPKTEQDLRDYLKANGATDLYIKDYVTKAKGAGKI